MRELLGKLVLYWFKLADSAYAHPVDLRLAGLLCEYGVGADAPNPAAAKAWFKQDADTRRREHIRAAQEHVEGLQRQHGTLDIDIGIIENKECSDYDPRMFDEELKAHLFATVRAGADDLKLGLSAKQKEAFAQYIVETFEVLLSPSSSESLRLPEKPPELYATRKARDELGGQKENIVQFITRVYAREIELGIIAVSDLSSLDRSAYNALYSWNSLHQDNPFEFPRPSRKKLRLSQARRDTTP